MYLKNKCKINISAKICRKRVEQVADTLLITLQQQKTKQIAKWLETVTGWCIVMMVL